MLSFFRFLSLMLFMVLEVHAELVVSHRSPYTPLDTHHNYSTELLRLALEKTRGQFGDFRMQGIPPRNYMRSIKAAVDNEFPNLALEATYDKALTQQGELTFINFPVDLGVQGYRVCFINPKLKASGKRFDSLQDLRPYSFAHGVGWADTQIFRHSGLTVNEVENYDSIFLILLAGRMDFFCRGANEVLGEIEQFKELTLSIDDSFVLVYPQPRFFYLNSKNFIAKERIGKGLQLAYADGSMQQLWKKHFKASIDFVKITNRSIIRLNNPLLQGLAPSTQSDFLPLLQSEANNSKEASSQKSSKNHKL